MHSLNVELDVVVWTNNKNPVRMIPFLNCKKKWSDKDSVVISRDHLKGSRIHWKREFPKHGMGNQEFWNMDVLLKSWLHRDYE